MDINISGTDIISRNISNAITKLKNSTNKGTENVANYLKSQMKSYTPIKTGGLVNSITVVGLNSLESEFVHVVIITAKYAAWIEFGRNAPHEFLPYGRTKTRDYSKSLYYGANNGSGYIRPALVDCATNGYSEFIKAFKS